MNSKHHDKCKFALKFIQLSTIFNLFPSEVVQRCQYCQLCVLLENSVEWQFFQVSVFTGPRPGVFTNRLTYCPYSSLGDVTILSSILYSLRLLQNINILYRWYISTPMFIFFTGKKTFLYILMHNCDFLSVLNVSNSLMNEFVKILAWKCPPLK